MLKSRRWRLCLLASVALLVLVIAGCGRGGTTATVATSSTLSGDVTFPDDAANRTSKTAAKTVGLAAGSVLVDVFTLDNTKVKSGVATVWNDTTKSYSYTVSDLTPVVDYVIRAVKTKLDGSTLTLKKIVEKANVAEGKNSGIAVDTVTTTVVTVVEKKLFDADNTMKVTLGDDTIKLPPTMADSAALSKKINSVVGSAKAFEDKLNSITDTKGDVVTANISGADTAELKALLAELASLLSQVKIAVQASVPTHDLIVEQTQAAIDEADTKITTQITTYTTTGTTSLVGVKDIKTITTDSINVYTPPADASLKFTTAMLSGKSFTYTYTGGNSGGGSGATAFNADGTKTGGGTWSINLSGQLVISQPNETDKYTIASATSSTIVTTFVATMSDGSTSSGTLTLTESSSPSPATDFTSAAGTYNGTFYKNGVRILDFFTLTVDSAGKVSGISTDGGGATFSGALTTSGTTGVFNYSGTADLEGKTSIAMSATLDTATGIFAGTVDEPSKSWTAFKYTTPPDFSSAVGSYNVTSTKTTHGILTVGSNGTVTITDGGTVVASGILNATASSTLFDVMATFTSSDNVTGALNTATGQFSGIINEGSSTWSAARATSTNPGAVTAHW